MFRSTFSEWYSPDEQTIADIIRNGTIALDTNVLLSLYRISAVARKDLLTLLGNDRIRPRLFIPYQVGLEYQRRRVSVAIDQSIGYRNVETRIERVRSELSALAVKEDDNDIRDNQVRDELNTAAENAVKASNNALDRLVKKVEHIRQTHMIADSQLAGADPVRDALEDLFADDGQVGTKPEEEELGTRQREATKRYAAKVPPGYEDAVGKNAKDDPSGDYLIWRELLDRAALKTGPIMFVTDDKKPDWYAKDKQGRILGPRAELRAEMAIETTHPYHQTPLNSFLYLVEQHLGLTLTQDTVDQVKEASNIRNFTVGWNPTDSPVSKSTWTVPMTRESLLRAQRFVEGMWDRKVPNRVELLTAVDRILLEKQPEPDVAALLIDIRSNILADLARNAEAEANARRHEELTNEMKSTRDWENYSAERDHSSEDDDRDPDLA